MDSKSFADTNNLQTTLSYVKKFARNIALMLLLVSFVIPISYMAINTQAHQDTNQINPNTKVTVEKVRKDKSIEIEETTLEELKSDIELANLGNFNQTAQAAQSQLQLTPEKIQEIENQQGVVYQNEVAIVDPSTLTSLGYNSQQIQVIEAMADFYNAQSIKSINLKFNTNMETSKYNFFSVQAQAAPCQDELKYESQILWGWRYRMNKCLVNHIEGNNNWVAILGSFGAGVVICPIACTIISVYIQLHINELIKIHKECDENGVFLDIYWSGDIEYKHVC
jgi:hypothetical protein